MAKDDYADSLDHTVLENFLKDPMLVELKKEMIANGIREIWVSYIGAGDSGEINDSKITDINGNDVSYSPSYSPRLALDFYDLVEVFHSGYSINEGGFGEITITVKDGVLLVKHSKTDFEPTTVKYSFSI